MGARTLACGLIAVVAVAGVGASGCDGPPDDTPTSVTREVTLDLGTPGMPMVPDAVAVASAVHSFAEPATLPLYQTQGRSHPLDKAGMERLAEALGIEGIVTWAAQGFSNDEYSVTFLRGDTAACFSLQSNTGIDEYIHLLEEGGDLPDCPSEDEAVGIADAFFEGAGLRQGLEFVETGVQESIGSRDLTRYVAYQTRLGGLPLLGPGAKISVTVGPKGEIIRAKHWVVPSAEGPSVKLRMVDAAIADVSAGKGLPPVRMSSEDVEAITMTDVSLAYWAEPAPAAADYYAPVYVFSVQSKNGDRGQWIVSALAQ